MGKSRFTQPCSRAGGGVVSTVAALPYQAIAIDAPGPATMRDNDAAAMRRWPHKVIDGES
jgi:hypothetical protein